MKKSDELLEVRECNCWSGLDYCLAWIGFGICCFFVPIGFGIASWFERH